MARSIKLSVVLTLILAAVVHAAARSRFRDTFKIELPPGIPVELWSYYVPKNNPVTPRKVELGRRLFFDPRLSADRTISCATCHRPDLAFTDGKPSSEGIEGRKGHRNSPTLLNAMFYASQFWDGRAGSLEAQAKLPLVDPAEMGNSSFEEVVDRLQSIDEYAEAFRAVFGGPVTIDRVGMAIATFERTLVSATSPFDRFLAGDRGALSEAAIRGLALYRGRARCNVCHTIHASFPFLTDQSFRNTGVAASRNGFGVITFRAIEAARGRTGLRALMTSGDVNASSLGRFLVTGNTLDMAAFRTPSLRNVELSAPYFHDGSAATLADVVRFYVNGGIDNPFKDWELQAVALDDNEQADLIAFLKSLTSDDAKQSYRPDLE